MEFMRSRYPSVIKIHFKVRWGYPEIGLIELWYYCHSYLGCSATTGAERAFKGLLQHFKNKQVKEQLRIRLELGDI